MYQSKYEIGNEQEMESNVPKSAASVVSHLLTIIVFLSITIK